MLLDDGERAGTEAHVMIALLMLVVFLKKRSSSCSCVSIVPHCAQMAVLWVDSIYLRRGVRCLELEMLLRAKVSEASGCIRSPIKAAFVATVLYAHFIASREDRRMDGETEAQGTAVSN